MESQSMIYIVSEYASQGEIFGKLKKKLYPMKYANEIKFILLF